MSRQQLSVRRDGECFTLPAPFAGPGSGLAEVGAVQYCATMRAYYNAFAAACRGKGSGDGECGGDAGVFGGEYVGRYAGRIASFGGDGKFGGCGDKGDADGYLVSGGLAGSGCIGAYASASRPSGEHAKSFDTNDDEFLGRDGIDVGSSVADEGEEVIPEWRKTARPLGKNYQRNKRRREAGKRCRREVAARRGYDSAGCVSSASESGTVKTVDSRTAVEIEAVQTLAARRVAENKVAVALAEHKLRALSDKDRTVMVDRLAAARGEQRINEAKEKSQASFKKCDQSLKSLGSSGSAGEFALKQEVKKAKDNEAIRLYVEKQAQVFAKYATPDVLQMVAAIPAPVLQDEFEAFGECPSEYGEDEQEAYFDELNRRNEENFDRCATYC